MLPVCRLSLMHTCSGWYAAVAEGPRELLPAAVLTSSVEVTHLNFAFFTETGRLGSIFNNAYNADMEQALDLVEHASCLFPHTWRVRIVGEAQVRLLAHLQLLAAVHLAS